MKEIWKDIVGYEGLYQVSSLGSVKSLSRVVENAGHYKKRTTKTRTLKQEVLSSGYKTVTLCRNGDRKKKRVHRLVAKSFVPNPKNKPYVNHKDGDKQNNRVENLAWCTHSENVKHAFDTGLKHISEYHKERLSEANRGSKHGNSKLTEDDIPKIKALNKRGLTNKAIAKRFGVCDVTIGGVINGSSWGHV